MERGTRNSKTERGRAHGTRNEKGKISDGTRQNTTPPTTKKSVSVRGLCAYKAREPNHYYYAKFVYLRMDYWAIELQNRMRLGFLVGVNTYWAEEEGDYSEVQFHLGIISINFLWS
jgi:hypothetical protein